MNDAHVKHTFNVKTCFIFQKMSATRDQQGGEVDDDRVFLDQVLNKLYDFGESERYNNRLTLTYRC